jgi:ankyrin repeat protein
MVSALLDLGANPTISAGKGGETSLHWIALIDNQDAIKVIECLLDHGANINTQSDELRFYPWKRPRAILMGKIDILYVGSPLHWAVLDGKINNVRFLVSKGALVDVKNRYRFTPLAIAVCMRRSDLLLALLEGRRSTDNEDDGTLLRYLYFDSTRSSRLLQGFGDEDEARTLALILRSAPHDGDEGKVSEYFKWSIGYGVGAMMYGLLSKLLDGLEHCYATCESENQNFSGIPLARKFWQDMRLLHSAVKRNDPEILDLILRKGAYIKELDDMSYTCLHTAAVSQCSDACSEVLLRHGAKVDWRTNLGWLPFHFAVLAGNTAIAQALVDIMSTEQISDALGIFYAPKSNKYPMNFLGHAISLRGLSFASIKGIEWLLDSPHHIVDFKSFCPEGKYTPLHIAVDGPDFSYGVFKMYGRLPILRLLLSKFNSPEHLEARSHKGVTALHLAAWLGKFEETRLLVDAGADMNALSADGTPLDFTFIGPPSYLESMEPGPTREMIKRFMEGRNAVAKFLRSRGAKSVEEITLGITLRDVIPYAVESGEYIDFFNSSTFARMRWGRRRYGCTPIMPRLELQRYMRDDLTAKALVIPEKVPDGAAPTLNKMTI